MTQPLGHNYGGIIQNYALQTVLKDMGNHPITINRAPNRQHSELRVFLSRSKEFLFKYFFGKDILTYWELEKTKKNTYKFIKQYINMSPVLKSNESLLKYFDKGNFDAVIVGSDQTWRPMFSPDIFNYFLDFLTENKSIKKIAYASSFGTSEWEFSPEKTKRAAELIKQFDDVSVREDSGIDLCEKYLNIKAIHTLDPSMLLKAEDYNKIIKQPEKNRGLFSYVLDNSAETSDFISKQAASMNMESYTIEPKINANSKKRAEDYIKPPVEDWVACFRDANFVITDSFHGTVFSILYKKPFISVANKMRGAARFESILRQLGLENRLLKDTNDFDPLILSKEIDYDAVSQKLEDLRRQSIDFLRENLSQ